MSPLLGQGLRLSTPCKYLPFNVTKEAMPQVQSSAFITGTSEIDKPAEKGSMYLLRSNLISKITVLKFN